MNRRLAHVAVVATLALSGCASAEPTFYALTPARGQAQPLAMRTVRVRRPGLAGYLNRPEIVKRIAEFKIGFTTNENWGEPLDEMVGRVLAQDIADRCPGTSVFADLGSITAEPEATVEVDIQRLDTAESGDVELVAQLSLRVGSGEKARVTTTPVTLRQRPRSGSTRDLVEAMSALLGVLADQVVTSLRG